MSNDLVNVAVPRQHLSHVYGLIAKLEGSVAPIEAPTFNNPPSTNLATDEWTPTRIRKMVEQSETPMRSALKALASRAGEWVSTQVLAEARGGGADWNTIAGMLGAFGRRCKSRYGLETKPYQERHEHGVGKVYCMSKEVAQHVLQALKNGH